MLDIRRPESFPNDEVFVHFVEERAVMVCGKMTDKEDESKVATLGGRKRLNRVFDLMGVAYEDRPPFKAESSRLPAVLAVPAAGATSGEAQRHDHGLRSKNVLKQMIFASGASLLKLGKEAPNSL